MRDPAVGRLLDHEHPVMTAVTVNAPFQVVHEETVYGALPNRRRPRRPRANVDHRRLGVRSESHESGSIETALRPRASAEME